MSTLLGRGRGPGVSSSARDLRSDDFSDISLDDDEREFAARSMERC